MSRHRQQRRKPKGEPRSDSSRRPRSASPSGRNRLVPKSVARQWKTGRGWPGEVRRWWRRLRKVTKILLAAAGAAATGVTLWGVLALAFSTQPPALNVAVVVNTADFSSRAPYVPEYLFHEPAKDLAAPPDGSATALELYGASPAAGRWTWAHRLGGVDAENTLVHLVLTRNGVAPVDVTELAVADLRCSAPRAGTLATYDWHYISSDADVAESYGAPGGARYFLTHLDGLPGYMGISSDRGAGGSGCPSIPQPGVGRTGHRRASAASCMFMR